MLIIVPPPPIGSQVEVLVVHQVTMGSTHGRVRSIQIGVIHQIGHLVNPQTPRMFTFQTDCQHTRQSILRLAATT